MAVKKTLPAAAKKTAPVRKTGGGVLAWASKAGAGAARAQKRASAVKKQGGK